MEHPKNNREANEKLLVRAFKKKDCLYVFFGIEFCSLSLDPIPISISDSAQILQHEN